MLPSQQNKNKDVMTRSELIEYYFNIIVWRGKNLNEQDMDDLDSCRLQYQKHKTLSDKEVEILERIYAEKTD